MSYDPTNANAVAGPSRLINSTLASPAPALSASQTPPRAPGLPLVDPTGTTPNPTPPVVNTEVPTTTTTFAAPKSPKGPTIVPTVVGSDGSREVPSLFELCQVDDLITLIASMLDKLISHNDRIPLTPTSLTRFHSRAPPSINVRDYLLRIARYTNVEPCCLLILLPYVDKVCARQTTFTISSLTVHRFIIAGVSVGSKALSDSFCTNGRYARVGGVSIAEMNLLEKEFCEAIDWRLTTTGNVLSHYYTSLVVAHPQYRLPASAILPPGFVAATPEQVNPPSQPLPPTQQPIPLTSDLFTPPPSNSTTSTSSNLPPPGSSTANSSPRSSSSTSSSPSSSSPTSPTGDVPMADNSTPSSPSSPPPTQGSRRPSHYASALPSHIVASTSSSTTSQPPQTASPALIPPPNLDHGRFVSASNLPSPVGGTLSTSASSSAPTMRENGGIGLEGLERVVRGLTEGVTMSPKKRGASEEEDEEMMMVGGRTPELGGSKVRRQEEVESS